MPFSTSWIPMSMYCPVLVLSLCSTGHFLGELLGQPTSIWKTWYRAAVRRFAAVCWRLQRRSCFLLRFVLCFASFLLDLFGYLVNSKEAASSALQGSGFKNCLTLYLGRWSNLIIYTFRPDWNHHLVMHTINILINTNTCIYCKFILHLCLKRLNVAHVVICSDSNRSQIEDGRFTTSPRPVARNLWELDRSERLNKNPSHIFTSFAWQEKGWLSKHCFLKAENILHLALPIHWHVHFFLAACIRNASLYPKCKITRLSSAAVTSLFGSEDHGQRQYQCGCVSRGALKWGIAGQFFTVLMCKFWRRYANQWLTWICFGQAQCSSDADPSASNFSLLWEVSQTETRPEEGEQGISDVFTCRALLQLYRSM